MQIVAVVVQPIYKKLNQLSLSIEA